MALSVVILSYNVKDLLRKAISAVYGSYRDKKLQVIVVDNASSDGSSKMVKEEFPKAELIQSKTNTGFSAGNNLARKITKGDYVLFLNPDTEVGEGAIKKCLEILKNNKEIGVVTSKVLFPNGKIDYSCHRGLPTVWNTFCYWAGLSKIFPKSKLFSGYTATYLDPNESHYIECISGTFLMIKRKVLDKIDWWDEDYWWNGDDIELCYQIGKAGYKIWYEASISTLHYKGASSGLWRMHKMNVPKETKLASARSAAKVMNIFIEKHSDELGPWPLVFLVRIGIRLLEKYRLFKIERGLKYV